MKTLIIDKEDSELRYQGNSLTVYCAGKRINTVAIKQLERVIVSPHVALTAGVLGVIAEQKVALMVLNARLPKRTATLSGAHNGDAQRRLAQYQATLNHDFCVQVATRLVSVKIERQRNVLKAALHKRPELRHTLTKAIAQLNTALNQLGSQEIVDLSVLNGIEGAAAMQYFKAYTQLFCASLNFTARQRRPPQDPVNAILSLSYTLLHHEAVNAIKMQGLDPALGCYHQLSYGRDSLACDLIEPLRPYLDQWIWRLFAQQILTSTHFTEDAGACLLNQTGKPIFYKQFFSAIKPIKRLLRYYAQHILNHIQTGQTHG